MTAWKPGDGIPDARIAADGQVFIGETELPGPIERHSVMVVPDAKRVLADITWVSLLRSDDD